MRKSGARKTGKEHRLRGALARILLLAGMLCILLVASMRDGKSAYAAALRTENDPVKIAVDLAKPAVVRIITAVSGHLTVNFSPTHSVTFPQGIGKAYEVDLSGTGTFITAHADMLTADHVVNPPAQVFQDAAAGDVTTYINQHPELSLGQMTPTQVDQALQTGQIKSSPTYDVKRSEAFLSTDYTGPLSATDLSGVPQQFHAPIDQIEKESVFDQKDVAIVHAAFTGFDTPSIQLGDSSSVQQQDELTIIGFPGNGDVSSRPTDLLTSSVNKITVSSLKTTDSGAPVIQVSGNVEHGDSGAPALDSKGAVVGIVSFGLSDGSPGETSFLQASMSARTLIQELNLDMTPGSFQREWSQAFTDYSATTPGHWHKAAQELASIAATYPLFQAVTPYLMNAQIQAKTEQVPSAPEKPKDNGSPGLFNSLSLPMVVWTCGVIVLLILLVAFFSQVAFRYRGKRETRGRTLVGLHTRHAAYSPLPQKGSVGAGSQRTPPPSKDDDRVTRAVFQQPLTQMPATQTMIRPSWPANASHALYLWPCKHMNRPEARFCRVCGKPAPLPTVTCQPSLPDQHGYGSIMYK